MRSLPHASNDTIDPERLAELERRLVAVEKSLSELAATRPDHDGWERLQARARRLGVSVRTIDRRVEAGLLEKHKPEGSNTAYVREIPGTRPKRRRRVPSAGDDGAAEPAAATPGGPVWPFGGDK